MVTAFLEKTQDPPTDQINAGCYVFAREVIERIPKGRLSVEREVFPALLSDGLRVCGYVDATYWRDMGTPGGLRARFGRPGPRHRTVTGAAGSARRKAGARRGGGGAGALLIGGTVVGRGAEIGPGARLDGAVIFDGARIEAGSVIERSIIGFGARIGPRALIRDGVIGDGADIGARCELLRGARVWPGVAIPTAASATRPTSESEPCASRWLGVSRPFNSPGGNRDSVVTPPANCVSPKSVSSGSASSGHQRRSNDSSLQAISASGGACAMNCRSR